MIRWEFMEVAVTVSILIGVSIALGLLEEGILWVCRIPRRLMRAVRSRL